MGKCSASSIKIKQISVALTLKNRDVKNLDIKDCLRPSIVLEDEKGKRRTVVLTNWAQHERNWFTEIRNIIGRWSHDDSSSVHAASIVLWKKIRTAAYAEARRKATKERFEKARRKAIRNLLLDDIKKTLASYSRGKEHRTKYLRPADLASVWKAIQAEGMIKAIMDA